MAEAFTATGRLRGARLVARAPILRSPLNVVALVLIALFALCAVFAPLIAPYDPLGVALGSRLEPPSPEHWLGTDQVGRDILSRLLYGSRISLVIGVAVVASAGVFGTFVGLIAGYASGLVDEALMEFVEAARGIGASQLRIILRHLLPNAVAPLMVQASFDMGSVIIAAAGLSFIGFGAQPPTPEWGVMISEGRNYISTQPWLSLFPGLAILLAVGSFNLLGDGLRDAFDPRLSRAD